MSKAQRTFTKKFKLEAVRLVQTSGKSMTQVAHNLGVADSTLHHWCQQYAQQGEQAFPGSGHQSVQEKEPRQLRRGLEVVKQERDIYAGEQEPITQGAFRFEGVLKSVAFLTNLHYVSPITGVRWATTLPPPSVPCAGILTPIRVQGFQSSPVPR